MKKVRKITSKEVYSLHDTYTDDCRQIDLIFRPGLDWEKDIKNPTLVLRITNPVTHRRLKFRLFSLHLESEKLIKTRLEHIYTYKESADEFDTMIQEYIEKLQPKFMSLKKQYLRMKIQSICKEDLD